MLLAFVVSDVLVYFAGERMAAEDALEAAYAVLFIKGCISAALGVAWAFLARGDRPASVVFRECCSPMNIARVLHVSLLFSVSILSLLRAFSIFDGTFIKLLSQMKLPLTAFFASTLLGRRYTAVEWQIILLICVACLSFTALKLGGVTSRGELAGLLLVIASILASVLGSLLGEKALKDGRTHFTSVMTNLRFGEVICSALFLLCFAGPVGIRRALSWSSQPRAVVVATLVADTWLSGLVVLRLSSVVKGIAKCSTVVVLYAMALAMGRQKFNLPQALGALMIVQLTALFVSVPRIQAESGSEPPPPPPAAGRRDTDAGLAGVVPPARL